MSASKRTLAGDVAGVLLTDLYELNMAVRYLRRGMTGPATFSLFVRRLPLNVNVPRPDEPSASLTERAAGRLVEQDGRVAVA